MPKDRYLERILDQGRDLRTEDLWAEQERSAREEKRRANRVRWAQFHRSQAERLRRTLEDVAAYHESRAEMLERDVS